MIGWWKGDVTVPSCTQFLYSFEMLSKRRRSFLNVQEPADHQNVSTAYYRVCTTLCSDHYWGVKVWLNDSPHASKKAKLPPICCLANEFRPSSSLTRCKRQRNFCWRNLQWRFFIFFINKLLEIARPHFGGSLFLFDTRISRCMIHGPSSWPPALNICSFGYCQ